MADGIEQNIEKINQEENKKEKDIGKLVDEVYDVYSYFSPGLAFSKLSRKMQFFVLALHGISVLTGAVTELYLLRARNVGYFSEHKYLLPLPTGPSVVMSENYLQNIKPRFFIKSGSYNK